MPDEGLNQLSELVQTIIAYGRSKESYAHHPNIQSPVKKLPMWESCVGRGINPIKINHDVWVALASQKGIIFEPHKYRIRSLYIYSDGRFELTRDFDDPLTGEYYYGWDAFLQLLPITLPQIQEQLQSLTDSSRAVSERRQVIKDVLAPWAVMEALKG